MEIIKCVSRNNLEALQYCTGITFLLSTYKSVLSYEAVKPTSKINYGKWTELTTISQSPNILVSFPYVFSFLSIQN